jgi:hypothetical protein
MVAVIDNTGKKYFVDTQNKVILDKDSKVYPHDKKYVELNIQGNSQMISKFGATVGAPTKAKVDLKHLFYTDEGGNKQCVFDAVQP